MGIKDKSISIRTLLSQNKGVIAPCVFDCSSARAAYLAGFKALCLSSAELSMSMFGLPDLGILSLTDVESAVRRITATCPLPLIVDAEDGYGVAQHVYHTCKRLSAAGAAAILMEDEAQPGFAKGVVVSNIVDPACYVAKIKAAKDALAGTDCLFIARTNVLIDTPEGFDDAIKRCHLYQEAGADMLLINQLKTKAQTERFCREFPDDLKMFPDLNQAVGQETVVPEELYETGIHIITAHFMMKASMVGMLNYALRVAEDQNNTFTRDQTPYNVSGQSGHPFFPVQEWLDLEERFDGEHHVFWGDTLDLGKR